jgi:hypothetical protein
MLHMVVLTHGPVTCPGAHPEAAELARTGVDGLAGLAQQQVTVQGSWVDPPGHVTYVLADAPNAHAINAAMVSLKFTHWNTVAIHPVVSTQEALALAAR